MTNHIWTGFTILMSAVGLIFSVAAEKDRESKANNTQTRDVVKIPQRGVAVLRATNGYKVRGVILLTQTKEGVRLRGNVQGLKPGKHGFHIHEFGDLRSPDGTAAGGHFNPQGHKHGAPGDARHHAGDLGNITAGSNGTARVDVMAKGMKLHFIVGRGIVVHAKADDLKSQPSGNAGPRVAVGVIGFAGAPSKSAALK